MCAQHASPRLHILENRRKQAAQLFAKGDISQADVSRRLRVSRMSVSRWFRQWKQSGSAGLKAAPRAGRKPLLDAGQLRRIQTALVKGARAYGFPADHWTLPRVAKLITHLTGVRYHPGHVWKILGAMNWSVQKPEQQAKERDADAVDYWKTVRWPELKKTLLASVPGSFSRTKRGSRSNRQSAEPGRREDRLRS